MEIKFTGESFTEIAVQMQTMLQECGWLDGFVEAPGGDPAGDPDMSDIEDYPEPKPETKEVPEPKKTGKSKPKPEPGQEPADEETGEDLAAVKKEALDKLMAVYLEGSDDQKAEIKKLLKQFDVKKFSDVPEARAKELLEEAEKL